MTSLARHTSPLAALLAGETRPPLDLAPQPTAATPWRIVERFTDDAGVMGDLCVSDVHVALYGRRDSGGRTLRYQVSYYVEPAADGDGYLISEQDQEWTAQLDSGGHDHGRDRAEISYPDPPDVMLYADAEQAEASCRRLAAQDISSLLA
jgi:hypothetical protein